MSETALLLFVSSFAIVFLLGMQSLTVNAGHTLAAMINSTLIGCTNIFILKAAPAAHGWDILGYVLGGPLGIATSMYVFSRYRARKLRT